MPEAQLIQSSAHVDGDRLRELQRIMREGGEDIADLIPAESVTAPPEEVITPYAVQDVERASLALIHASVASEDGAVPNLKAALGKAGMTPEMFRQMTDSPTFFADFKDLNRRYFWIACLPQYLKALRERALAGDSKAYATMAEFFGEDKASLDDRAKSLVNATDDAILSEIRSTRIQLEQMERDLMRSLETPQGAAETEADAVRDALVVKKLGRR